MDPTLLLAVAFLGAATLYASVGHAGASAYLAAMALLGTAPETMRPTALALNILVAGIVTIRFGLAGRIPWRAIVPFIAASVPAAFIGGGLVLPTSVYRPLVGAVLLLAAIQLYRTASRAATAETETTTVPVVPALGVGAGIGLLSGLTGTGGGIFLTPLILFAGWSGARTAAGMSAVFILANSISGLLGNVASLQSIPPAIPLWLAAVAAGAVIGSELGARRLRIPALRRALAVVLVIAGLKLLLQV